jgi:hypothetical protein
MADPQQTPQQIQQSTQAQQEFNAELQVTNDTLISISKSLDAQLKLQQKIGKEVEQTAQEYWKDISKTLKQSAKDIYTISENQEQISRGALRSKTVQDQINKSLREQNKARLAFSMLEQDIANLNEEERRAAERERDDALAATEKQIALLRKQLGETQKIEKTAGLIAKSFEGLNKIPFLNKMLEFEKITERIYATSAKTGSSFKALGAGLKETYTQLGKKLKDPLVLLTAQLFLLKKIFNLQLDVNQQITEQGRQLGINYQQSQKLYDSAVAYSLAQNDGYTTQVKIAEGRKLLNDALETAVSFSNQESIEAKKLSDFYGVGAEQLKQMAINSARNNKTIVQTKQEILKTAVIQKAQYGGTLSYQKVMQKVNSVSGEILTKFKGNVPALVAAVQQADRLGLTLEQVDKIGESLLNFEQSIDAELKAELLTGKEINLERARAAALSGDQVKLMNEIVSQVGNIHKFERMNVIQRKAYAEAFGMTASEMGDMLRKREFEAKYGKIEQANAQAILDKAKARGATIDDTLKKELEQMSLQEKMKNVFSKLEAILIRITKGPMGFFLKMLEKSLGFVEEIIKKFSSITGGKLGSALGAVLMGAPLLIGAVRMFMGTAKAMLLGRLGSTRFNAMWTRDAMGAGGAGGGLLDSLNPFGGGGKGGKFGRQRGLVGRFGAKGARNLLRGAKGFGIGTAIGIGSDLIADQMDEGQGKDVVSGIGTTASWAGTGAMIGSVIPGIGTGIGAIVGGIAGGIKALIDAESNAREREEKSREKQEADKKTNEELMRQFLDRPIKINVGGKEIIDFNTAASQYGTQQSSFN